MLHSHYFINISTNALKTSTLDLSETTRINLGSADEPRELSAQRGHNLKVLGESWLLGCGSRGWGAADRAVSARGRACNELPPLCHPGNGMREAG